MKSEKIALIGMMGSGKTTIAKLLAEKIKFEFVDLDEVFERENNIKIKDYFKFFSEVDFRNKETNLLKKFSNSKNIIIATGGGIVLKNDNQKILFNGDIFTIYLKATVNTIYDRIIDDNKRPLLSVQNKKEKISKILSSRENLYNKANIIISTDDKTKIEIVNEIWKKLI